MRNEDLQHAFQSLEQSHKENSRIVRVVAHDLKNPISAIRTLIYSLLRKEEPGSVNREVFELIETTCIDSVALINDLLNNKRTLSDISKELVDMGRMIEQCAELFQIKAEEKKQQFKLQIDHPIIMMNRQKIWRVISNIVNNAIKFSPENAEISISLERKGSSVLLSVHDNGIGIPADLKDKIFTINPEKSREGTAGEKSYGLGLSIARKIIEEHSGKLWFESEPGKGSVFYVELPYSTGSEN
jgi:signal transduction histidine kinase